LNAVESQFAIIGDPSLYVNPPLKLRLPHLPLGSVRWEWSQPMNNHHRRVEPQKAPLAPSSRRARWARSAGIVGLAAMLATAMIVWLGLLGWAGIALFRWMMTYF
jgi:hypothetical protein